jgi:hypothetical protein
MEIDEDPDHPGELELAIFGLRNRKKGPKIICVKQSRKIPYPPIGENAPSYPGEFA